MVSEGAMQTSKQGKQSTILPSYDIYETQQPAWQANHKGAVVA